MYHQAAIKNLIERLSKGKDMYGRCDDKNCRIPNQMKKCLNQRQYNKQHEFIGIVDSWRIDI